MIRTQKVEYMFNAHLPPLDKNPYSAKGERNS